MTKFKSFCYTALMMTTITISLPDEMARTIDLASLKEGFATRSEYIRNLLRDHFGKTDGLTVFQKRPLEEVESKLRKSGKYGDKYIKGLIGSLSRSSVYAD